MYCGLAEKTLSQHPLTDLAKSVQLIFTSPPFPLNTKKRYGNLNGSEYVDWLAEFGPRFRNLLADKGSLVIEVGNAWEPGRPVMSTLALRALIALQEKADLRLCQEFICYNPARLPSPAQWVTVERIRVKDAYTRLWWMSASDRPKADNRRILQPYSAAMRQLLKRRKYSSGPRPSQHHIGAASFLVDHGGSIPPNVLTISNTKSNDRYQQYCRENGIVGHPARMPLDLASFFIKFLTEPGDLVLDPFAGSNTTGFAAETLKRRWISIEASEDYVEASFPRFYLDDEPKRRGGVERTYARSRTVPKVAGR
jgi:site-specific DNA-methyltransferase (cytosine-N4-specific)